MQRAGQGLAFDEDSPHHAPLLGQAHQLGREHMQARVPHGFLLKEARHLNEAHAQREVVRRVPCNMQGLSMLLGVVLSAFFLDRHNVTF